jgi:hypothetical protein
MFEIKYSSLSSAVEGTYVPAHDAMTRPPSDKKGSALQAASHQALEQNGLIAVSVPESLVPGDNLLVRAPDDSDRVISAVVPDGALPGHTFLVKIPAGEAPPIVAMGIPVQADLSEDTDTASHQQGSTGCGGVSLCFVALMVMSSVLYDCY